MSAGSCLKPPWPDVKATINEGLCAISYPVVKLITKFTNSWHAWRYNDGIIIFISVAIMIVPGQTRNSAIKNLCQEVSICMIWLSKASKYRTFGILEKSVFLD